MVQPIPNVLRAMIHSIYMKQLVAIVVLLNIIKAQITLANIAQKDVLHVHPQLIAAHALRQYITSRTTFAIYTRYVRLLFTLKARARLA